MTKTDSGYKFNSTGREFYANGYLGIFEDNDGILNIAEGYDGYISPDDDSPDLTKEEEVELADYMISLWEKFKNI